MRATGRLPHFPMLSKIFSCGNKTLLDLLRVQSKSGMSRENNGSGIQFTTGERRVLGFRQE